MSQTQFRRPATVFCDFDGTITLDDCVVAVWKKFAAPGWEKKVEDMLALRKSLREGVAEVFATVPSRARAEIAAYVASTVRLRPGLREFLQFCIGSDIGFVVASGGLDFFVEPVLAPLRPWLKAVHSLQADLSGPTIRLADQLDCPRCSLCKVKVMERYPGVSRILVGDSVTDLHGSEHADFVLARGRLMQLLNSEGRSYEGFEDFFEARDVLEKHVFGAASK